MMTNDLNFDGDNGFYVPSEALRARVNNDFTYHPASPDQQRRMQNIRDWCRDLAGMLLIAVPYSREQSLALTSLEQVSMWANAGIARHENWEVQTVGEPLPEEEKH